MQVDGPVVSDRHRTQGMPSRERASMTITDC